MRKFENMQEMNKKKQPQKSIMQYGACGHITHELLNKLGGSSGLQSTVRLQRIKSLPDCHLLRTNFVCA